MKDFHFTTTNDVVAFTIYKDSKPCITLSFTIAAFLPEFTRKENFFPDN